MVQVFPFYSKRTRNLIIAEGVFYICTIFRWENNRHKTYTNISRPRPSKFSLKCHPNWRSINKTKLAALALNLTFYERVLTFLNNPAVKAVIFLDWYNWDNILSIYKMTLKGSGLKTRKKGKLRCVKILLNYKWTLLSTCFESH